MLKVSYPDRLATLSTYPRFIADLKRIAQDRKEFTPEQLFDPKNRKKLLKIKKAQDMVKAAGVKLAPDPDLLPSFIDDLKSGKISEAMECENPVQVKKRWTKETVHMSRVEYDVQDGKLTVYIDLTRGVPASALAKQVKGDIVRAMRQVGLKNPKTKPANLDHWKIWHEHKNGKTIDDLVDMYGGRDGTAKQLKAKQEEVRRALRRAEALRAVVVYPPK